MFQNKNLSAVKKNALFKGVSNTNLNFNFNPKDFIEIGEGEIIYQSGDPSDFLYLIIEGEVKLKISRGVASPFILRKVYNDFFGEREVQENSVRKSSAIANKDTLIYIIRKIDLSSMTQRSRELRYNLLNDLKEDNEIESNKKETVFDGLIDKLPEQSFFISENNKSAEVTNYSKPEVIGNTGEENNIEMELNSEPELREADRKSTRLNSSHLGISYAVFCLKKAEQALPGEREAGPRSQRGSGGGRAGGGHALFFHFLLRTPSPKTRPTAQSKRLPPD